MKNKLILLVSMLLPLFSSCGDNPTIEPTPVPTDNPTVEPTIEPTQEMVYNYNEAEFTLDRFSLSPGGEPSLPIGISMFINTPINSTLIFELNDNIDDFYTCLYVHDEDINYIKWHCSKENPNRCIPNGTNDYTYLSYFSGINFLLLNYAVFQHSWLHMNHYNEHEYNKIKWYEIPLNDDIPHKMENYTLALISKKQYYTVYDMHKNYIGQMMVYVEQSDHELYKDYWQYNKKLSLPKYYIKSFDGSYNLPFLEVMHGIDPYDQFVSRGYKMDKFDNIDYICFIPRDYKDEEILKELIESYEYIQEGYGYWFKLIDIVSYKEEN